MKSLYDATTENGIVRLNNGFDYRNQILNRSLSNVLFKNSTISGFLFNLEESILLMIELPKKVKNLFNYTQSKNDFWVK